MTLFAEALPFAVVQTTPKGIVKVTNDTEIVIKDEAVETKTLVNRKASPTKMSVGSGNNCKRFEK